MASQTLTRSGAAIGVIAALFWASDALGQCTISEPFGHFQGSFLQNCPDSVPVAGFAYSLGPSANSGSSNIVCEDSTEVPQGGSCQTAAGVSGDGRITISGNWAGP